MIDKLLPTTFLNLRTRPTSHWGDITKPFFVTIGCSLTENTHIEYKDCWSAVLGRKLGLEHINIAFGGSCLEYQSEKVNQMWNILPHAKFCVWMQTYPIRKRRRWKWLGDHLARNQHVLAYEDPNTFQRQCAIIDQHMQENVLFTNCWGYDVPYMKALTVKYKGNNKFFINTNNWIDRAGDNLHAGPRMHGEIGVQLYEHITKNFPQWIK